jgi:hypothetical protein
MPKYEMNSFEVLNCRRATEVEEISANTNISSATACAGRDVRERVFDGCSLAQHSATWLGFLEFAKLLLPFLVNGNRNRSALARGGLCAFGAQGASPAGFWMEVDGFAWLELFHLSRSVALSHTPPSRAPFNGH